MAEQNQISQPPKPEPVQETLDVGEVLAGGDAAQEPTNLLETTSTSFDTQATALPKQKEDSSLLGASADTQVTTAPETTSTVTEKADATQVTTTSEAAPVVEKPAPIPDTVKYPKGSTPEGKIH